MRLLPLISLIALSACVSAPVDDVAQRRAVVSPAQPLPQGIKRFGTATPARPVRSNSSIAADFLQLSFQTEAGRTIRAFSRFEGPVTIALTGAVPASAGPDLAALLARLRSEAGIGISQTANPAAANITVQFLPRAVMQAAVPQAACFTVPRVGSWDQFTAARGTTTIDWTTLATRERAAIFIPADVAPQEIRDCLHEEVAQTLGPLNDLYHLSDSVFNDDNFHTVLTGFDMLILRATYAPELRSGMSRDEVAARLPAVLARINPAGGSGGIGPQIVTPREWITAIETALSPRNGDSARRAAAQRALAIAQAQGWSDNRRAFSHFVTARLMLANQVEQSVIHFAEAGRYYANLPEGALHQAHVDMQMAAFALSSGQIDEALRLTARSQPAASRGQNAAVLATLGLLRAEALQAAGRSAEAQASRLDSIGWARYAFGAEAQVAARLAEVAALAPRRTARR